MQVTTHHHSSTNSIFATLISVASTILTTIKSFLCQAVSNALYPHHKIAYLHGLTDLVQLGGKALNRLACKKGMTLLTIASKICGFYVLSELMIFYLSSLFIFILYPVELYLVMSFNNAVTDLFASRSKSAKLQPLGPLEQLATGTVLFLLQIVFFIMIKSVGFFSDLVIVEPFRLIVTVLGKLPILTVYHTVYSSITYWAMAQLDLESIMKIIDSSFYYSMGITTVASTLWLVNDWCTSVVLRVLYRVSLLYVSLIVFESKNGLKSAKKAASKRSARDAEKMSEEYESKGDLSPISHTSYDSCSRSETTCPKNLHKYKLNQSINEWTWGSHNQDQAYSGEPFLNIDQLNQAQQTVAQPILAATQACLDLLAQIAQQVQLQELQARQPRAT